MYRDTLAGAGVGALEEAFVLTAKRRLRRLLVFWLAALRGPWERLSVPPKIQIQIHKALTSLCPQAARTRASW